MYIKGWKIAVVHPPLRLKNNRRRRDSSERLTRREKLYNLPINRSTIRINRINPNPPLG
jgi:hypothetical protein